jgi:hypothetical protein
MSSCIICSEFSNVKTNGDCTKNRVTIVPPILRNLCETSPYWIWVTIIYRCFKRSLEKRCHIEIWKICPLLYCQVQFESSHGAGSNSSIIISPSQGCAFPNLYSIVCLKLTKIYTIIRVAAWYICSIRCCVFAGIPNELTKPIVIHLII